MGAIAKQVAMFFVGRSGGNGRPLKLQRSVLPLLGLDSPVGAITGCYGWTTARELISHTVRKENDSSIVPVEVRMQTMRLGKEWAATRTDYTDPEVDTLNLLRMSVDLKKEIQHIWNGYFRTAITMSEAETEMNFLKVATAKPEYISKLVKEPMFQHIKCVIYPVKSVVGVTPMISYFGDYEELKPVSATDKVTEFEFAKR